MQKDANLAQVVKWLAGAGVFGVPVLAAYLGHANKKFETSLAADKEFEAQKAKLKAYDEAIAALEDEEDFSYTDKVVRT